MFYRFSTRNSLRNRNLWLIGLEFNWVGGLLLAKDPGDNSRKDQSPMLRTAIVMETFNSLVSWIGIVASAILIVIALYHRLTTPAKIRELSWRAKSIEYRRAEDYLQLMQESYLPGSTGPATHNLEEARNRVEGITRRYADEVFPNDPETADKYVDLAKSLSEKRFESKVIHPTFWTIPASEAAAKRAVGLTFKDRLNAADQGH